MLLVSPSSTTSAPNFTFRRPTPLCGRSLCTELGSDAVFGTTLQPLEGHVWRLTMPCDASAVAKAGDYACLTRPNGSQITLAVCLCVCVCAMMVGTIRRHCDTAIAVSCYAPMPARTSIEIWGGHVLCRLSATMDAG
mmetsp:Transcript_57614/g.95250  ORF Transcript_57614/g.95250 Transcript_57614/m.95250 type:complete len:137 (-) Transcript_57614:297-707(-)